MSEGPLEVLLVSRESAEAFPTAVLHPGTATRLWSWKGLEGGEGVGEVAVAGGEFLVAASASKPLLSVAGLQRQAPAARKSVLPGTLGALDVSEDGRLAAGGVGTKVLVWELGSGRLAGLAAGAHYQPVTRVAFSEGGRWLASAAGEGHIALWLTADLLTLPQDSVEPARKWAAHSLAVSSLVFLRGASPRLLSGGRDQSVRLHDALSGELLFTAHFDRPVTALAVDAAEASAFVGLQNGTILQVNLFAASSREVHVSSEGDGGEYPVLRGHSSPVTQLSVSLDGGTLASGDQSGEIRLWHVGSGLETRAIKGSGPVRTLRFLPTPAPLLDPAFASAAAPPQLAKTLAKAPAETLILTR